MAAKAKVQNDPDPAKKNRRRRRRGAKKNKRRRSTRRRKSNPGMLLNAGKAMGGGLLGAGGGAGMAAGAEAIGFSTPVWRGVAVGAGALALGLLVGLWAPSIGAGIVAGGGAGGITIAIVGKPAKPAADDTTAAQKGLGRARFVPRQHMGAPSRAPTMADRQAMNPAQMRAVTYNNLRAVIANDLSGQRRVRGVYTVDVRSGSMYRTG